MTIVNAFCRDKQPWFWFNRHRSLSSPRVTAVGVSIGVVQQPPFHRVPIKVGVIATVVGVSQAGIWVIWVDWGSRIKWLLESEKN